MPSQSNFDAQHAENNIGYSARISKAYYAAITKATNVRSELSLDKNSNLFLRNNPAVNRSIDEIIDQLYGDVLGVTVDGIMSEWDLAVKKNNDLVKTIYGDQLKDIPKDLRNQYLSNNHDALVQFLARKDKGLGLSDKVWNNSVQFKTELELALETGIGSGQAASTMARNMKQYLQNPDALFRRVRSASGELRLSQAAKVYHPGQGVYRSSYKNALRLARNEINFSYEQSQQEKRKQQPFIVGVEIRVSPQHRTEDDKGGISCQSLQGKYPKDFDFSSKWHVNCKCMSLNIIKTAEELDADIDLILSGGTPTSESTNAVEILPTNYNTYVKDNAKMWKNWSNQPRFIAANKDLPTVPKPKPVVSEINAEKNKALLQELNSIKKPLTTPEMLINDRQILEDLEEAYGVEDALRIQKEYLAKSENYIPNTYFRYEGAGNSYAGVGNGLYVGRDQKALYNFYNEYGDRNLKLVSYTGDPKWLDIMDPRKQKIWDNYLDELGISATNSDKIGKIVQELGFDGIKYFDVLATGEEYVLFNTKKLVQLKRLPGVKKAGVPKPKPFVFESAEKLADDIRAQYRFASIDIDETVTKSLYTEVMDGFDIPTFVNEFKTHLQEYKGATINKITLRQPTFSSKNALILDIRGVYDGSDIRLTRSFYLEDKVKTIDHDFFKIPSEMQGKGFSKKVFKSLLTQYKNAKTKRLKVHANLDVGGYTWGKYGFAQKVSDIPSFIEEYFYLEEALRAKQILKNWKAKNPGKDYFPMNLFSNDAMLKRRLLGSDWEGILDFTDPTQTKIYEDYLNGK